MFTGLIREIGTLRRVSAGPQLSRLEIRYTPTLAGAMLDQRHAAGWGNVYVHDVPFVLGVSPFQPVGTFSTGREVLGLRGKGAEESDEQKQAGAGRPHDSPGSPSPSDPSAGAASSGRMRPSDERSPTTS